MPLIKSAKKRVKIANKANARNNRTKRSLREAIKAFNAALISGKPAEISKTEHQVMRAIDVAAKKDVIHRNKAARQKAQISAKSKKAGVKPTTKVSKKPAQGKPKAKPAAKTSTAKKPTTKK